MGRSLCAKGGAAFAQRYDSQRPTSPLIRAGKRGEGKWREASWDEAFDFVAGKLKTIISEYGARSIILSDRGGPFADLRQAFVKAIGSPNYINHDCTCGRNVHHASKSVYGLGRKDFSYDYEKTRHLVLFGRNITESLKVKEVKSFLRGVKNGARVTYIDPRATVTASKATRYWQIRPGTDYALLLGIAHCIVNNGYYDADFVERYVTGLPPFKTFLEPYTPEWAAGETGIPAEEIAAFCRELNEDRPRVIFHPGWMLARYHDSFYASRIIHILNALMGSIEVPGGLFYPKGAKDAGKSGLKSLAAAIPAVSDPRADGCGTTYPHFDKGAGMLQTAYDAIESGVPYPVKAYFIHRHNPLIALPDTREQERILDKLDLIVAVDVHYSESAWFADVILPESTFLERGDIIRMEKGLKPGFGRRQQCVPPLNDTKAGWEIYVELARRLDKGEHFPFASIEDIWNFQLQGTGVTVADFDAKGFVKLTDKAIWYDRQDLKFGTQSGKIEIVNAQWEAMGVSSLAAYASPEKPPAGSFRLLFGRNGYQAHGQHQNNPILSELLGSNDLWINTRAATQLGISNGDRVTVANGDATGTIRAKVTDLIHPEAVFMLHGFGKEVPAQKRAFGKGLADQLFMKGKLKEWDKAGGGLNLNECFVTVSKAASQEGSK
jgi:thiosulfate reductase/polysulfide reductase chain A